MTKIPFDDKFFSFLFSYNTSVHMSKEQFNSALDEFIRVLKPGGLCYVNFLSEECDSFGKGVEIRQGEFMQNEEGEEVLYSHYKEAEVEQYLAGFNIIYKEKRLVKRVIEDIEYTSGYIDYILKKK
ncbi:hypothetical protein SDC9_174723 [bioreactor metagenome]|uniref:Methyltransferase type 11 domain-containing protein n=1 Tax=bioreactor metagenome TaxID=1076179 RepID=A0A645GN24_9ZZZZ